jgi:hypothetical protein
MVLDTAFVRKRYETTIRISAALAAMPAALELVTSFAASAVSEIVCSGSLTIPNRNNLFNHNLNVCTSCS